MFDPVKGLAVKLADGTTWAARDKLDELPPGGSRRGSAERSSSSTTTATASPTCSCPVRCFAAVRVRDLLLRNDGNNAFTDVTAEAGLVESSRQLRRRGRRLRQRRLRRSRPRRPGRREALPQRRRQGVRGQDRRGRARQGDRACSSPPRGWTSTRTATSISSLAKYAQDSPTRREAVQGREGRSDRAARRVRERRRRAADAIPASRLPPLTTAFKPVDGTRGTAREGPGQRHRRHGHGRRPRRRSARARRTVSRR